MAEHDALVFEYSHLKGLPREKEALHSLRKIASLVKPIMRARNWKVGTLAEFFPDQQNLLGINMNRGQKICLRLRYPGDKSQFIPLEQVVDTMLHELSHNVHGPHDAKFHALWDQLRKEYEGLLSKGYTGEGFLSDGRMLGGRRVPRDEARRIARAAAEKRRTLHSGSGQRLGGAPIRAGTDIRRVIVDAIDRRNTVLKGCGAEKASDEEIKKMADQATRNGFKTKAEEDEANDRAISQALWDLVQEDQKKEYGESYIPSTPANPVGNGGGDVRPESSIRREAPVPPASFARSTTAPEARDVPARQLSRHMSRLVTENEKPTAKKPRVVPKTYNDSSAPDPPSPAQAPTGWTCPICTLHNPIDFLCCDACTTERPEEITIKSAKDERAAHDHGIEMVDLLYMRRDEAELMKGTYGVVMETNELMAYDMMKSWSYGVGQNMAEGTEIILQFLIAVLKADAVSA
ncbi:DNA-dependent metalloprotease WSS1 [Hyphodiscus hymeniophilus]|uniref:DNA-dependent metalloprotease WSS1 n=1 Tax=Hyphodiscus hymeniophilus TaxID=353542 RepID=A0A9P6VRG8_9HELO|nr:DNA-dependent metalloprotease WSS1 [Hyphodiscus hymeniophilus]